MLPLVIVRGRLNLSKNLKQRFLFVCVGGGSPKISKLGLDSADEAYGRYFCLLLHNLKWWSQGYSVIYMMGHGWLDPNILHDGRTVSGNHFLLGLGFAARCANSTKILFVFGPRLSSTNIPPSTLCIALLG